MAGKASSAKTRGSDLLKQQYSEQDLEKLLAAGDMEGVSLVEFSGASGPLPEPWGVWQVKREHLASLMDRLNKLDRPPYLKLFPKGTPWPDMFEIVFETSAPRYR